MKRATFTAADGKKISYVVWDDVQRPVGVLQIAHGMAEHIERYAHFAAFMNSSGYIVAGDDHRGHGQTDPDALGLSGDGDLFAKTADDILQLGAMLKAEYNLPVSLLGHSYGSFLTQSIIARGDTAQYASVILSGSALMTGAKIKFGYKIADSRCRRGKTDERGYTFAKLTFVSYDKKFKEGKNMWLCRDLEQVGKYNTDPLCGKVHSNGFYKYFFAALKNLAADDGARIDKNLKLYIISGSEDLLGNCGKLVERLKNRYVSFGLKPQFKLFIGGRHEILNEINRESVYDDVLAFLNCPSV